MPKFELSGEGITALRTGLMEAVKCGLWMNGKTIMETHGEDFARRCAITVLREVMREIEWRAKDAPVLKRPQRKAVGKRSVADSQ